MGAKQLFGAACAASLSIAGPGLAQVQHNFAIPAASAVLRIEVARTIQNTLAASGGLPAPVRVERLRAAILTTIGADAGSMAAAQSILAGITPSAFSDPAAVTQAIAEVRIQISLRLNPRPTAQIVVRHDLGPKHSYVQPEDFSGALPPPAAPSGPTAAPPPPPPPPPPPTAADHVAAPAPLQTARLGAPVPAASAHAGAVATPAVLSGLQVEYNAPDVLPLGAKTDFRLIIESARPTTSADFAGLPSPTKSRVIRRGVKIVKAEMHGPTDWVDIDAGGAPACQEVTGDSNPTWDWFVTPKTTHALNLWVELDEVASCDQAAPIVDRIDSFSIPVSASLWQLIVFYAKSWQTVLGAILALIAAAGGAFGAWRWIGKGPSAKT